MGGKVVLSDYPKILKAVDLLLSDNGCDHRDDEGRARAFALKTIESKWSTAELSVIDRDLSALNRADFETLCVGEESEAIDIGAQEVTNRFLDSVWELIE